MTDDWRELHATAVVADTHNDLLCAVVARRPDEWGSYFRQVWLPQLRLGGVDIQVLPVFVDDVFRPEGALRQTLRMIECAPRVAAENPRDAALCVTGAEIDNALSSGRIALVLALESAPGIGEDVELFRTLQALGVRIASFAHFGRTALADGSAEDATGGRLTSKGVAALELLEELGVLVDVSHLGVAGVGHVLEIANRPVIATHSSARALRDHHRNLTDEQIKGIGATGGLVCVNFFAPFLAESNATLDVLVDHIEHVVSLIGVDSVGLGPDFIKEVYAETKPAWCEAAGARVLGSPVRYLDGLEGPAGLPLVTELMVGRGWDPDGVRAVLGGNVLRLFRASFGTEQS
ncbi:dipeptidase [Kribbella solani]|uniref:Membrane dipeptidase n=1 Tax=Kribbella solani TaxID=236067 RepID=A0A841DH94_9ACTN|nr:membrane dipeptidase [Kribbella solani]MBB5977271.1 membrane dipeptidase [Kribbella solani]